MKIPQNNNKSFVPEKLFCFLVIEVLLNLKLFRIQIFKFLNHFQTLGSFISVFVTILLFSKNFALIVSNPNSPR